MVYGPPYFIILLFNFKDLVTCFLIHLSYGNSDVQLATGMQIRLLFLDDTRCKRNWNQKKKKVIAFITKLKEKKVTQSHLTHVQLCTCVHAHAHTYIHILHLNLTPPSHQNHKNSMSHDVHLLYTHADKANIRFGYYNVSFTYALCTAHFHRLCY